MKKLVLIVAAIVLVGAIGLVITVRMLIDPERMRATIVSEASARLGIPVTLAAVTPSFWPRAGLAMTDLVVGEPSVVTLHHLDVNTPMRALLSRRIEDAEVIVSDSHVNLPALLHVIDRLNAASAAAPAGSAASPPVTIVNVKTLAFRNVEVALDGRSAQVSLESSFSGDRLELGSLEVITPVSTIKASGTIESLAGRRAKLTATADPLDLDGLMAFFAGAAGAQDSEGARGAQAPIDVDLDLSAAKGRAAGVAFDALETTIHVTPESIALEPLALGMFGGRIEGSAQVTMLDTTPALTVNARLSGIDMTAVSAFAGHPGAISGHLGGQIALSGSGTEPAAALRHATGQGTAAITDGAMPNLHLVRTIVLAFGKPAGQQPAGGDAFSRLSAGMQLANNVVRFTNLSFQSPDVQFNGAGTLALAGSRLNIAGNATLSEALTAQAGRDLVRFTEEGGRVTVAATVTGTATAPAVGVDLSAVAKRAMTNELKRQLEKQTGSLFDRLTGKKKKP